MLWSSDWVWGMPLLMLTVVFHVCAFVLIVKALMHRVHSERNARNLAHFFVAIALTALSAAALHGLEAMAWAILYVRVGADVRFVQLHVVFAQRDHELRPFESLPGGPLEAPGSYRGDERANIIWPDDRVPVRRHRGGPASSTALICFRIVAASEIAAMIAR